MRGIFEKIKGLFKRDKVKAVSKKNLCNPYRDWAMVFFMSIIGFVAVLSFGVFLFFSISDGSYYHVDSISAEKKKPFDENRLIKRLEAIENKKINFEKVLKEEIIISDPSN